MWRVIHQYMDTMNGPADFLEVPVSPVTGTVFANARSTKMVHIAEFTADLVNHGKLSLDPRRNDRLCATFHDSCNPARAMGLIEEPREVLRAVCRRFFEMSDDTIREKTLCCGSGAGLGGDENMEMRLRGGMPRGLAVRQVRDAHAVNRLVTICAIDRVSLQTVCDYWSPGVTVMGLDASSATLWSCGARSRGPWTSVTSLWPMRWSDDRQGHDHLRARGVGRPCDVTLVARTEAGVAGARDACREGALRGARSGDAARAPGHSGTMARCGRAREPADLSDERWSKCAYEPVRGLPRVPHGAIEVL